MIDLLNITQESSVLAMGEMSFSYVVVEGPSEEVLECNERENMDLNMYGTLITCTYIEESVPGQYITINSDTLVEGLGD